MLRNSTVKQFSINHGRSDFSYEISRKDEKSPVAVQKQSVLAEVCKLLHPDDEDSADEDLSGEYEREEALPEMFQKMAITQAEVNQDFDVENQSNSSTEQEDEGTFHAVEEVKSHEHRRGSKRKMHSFVQSIELEESRSRKKLRPSKKIGGNQEVIKTYQTAKNNNHVSTGQINKIGTKNQSAGDNKNSASNEENTKKNALVRGQSYFEAVNKSLRNSPTFTDTKPTTNPGDGQIVVVKKRLERLNGKRFGPGFYPHLDLAYSTDW